MRVLVLTQYYSPEPVLKFVDLVRGLRERGHEVQVITGFPCYPYGKTYSGYHQKLYTEEISEEVVITRIPQFPDHSRSFFRRALYYLSFAFSAATIGLWRARRADVILVYQSAFPIGLAAWVISRVKRIPYVCDVVDLWPESVAASGIMQNRMAFGLIRLMMKFIYHGARNINVITEGYRENLMEMGVPANKLSLIHCWPGTGQFDPVSVDPDLARSEKLEGRFTIMYSGTMGPVQQLRTVIEAALRLQDFPQLQFLMIGDGVEHAELEDFVKKSGATNVRFLGRKPTAYVQQLFPMAAALLVHLKSDPMSRISIPSKTFAYMASGRPLLMAVEGEAGCLVEKHQCGIKVEPSNPQALADVIREFMQLSEAERQQMGNNALLAYREHYRSDRQIDRLEKLLVDSTSSPIDNQRIAA